ncbi:kinase-like domain-containing protein [Rhizophagus clarus]|uniref:Kinase-like domain-containing protein n=1 Tax=Rhizophagus clarus TaxID=94130 RepID=A0A8H3QS99_9GLOM|nr:kinase-like domain-containing protein [Rhizophagus clarus]
MNLNILIVFKKLDPDPLEMSTANWKNSDKYFALKSFYNFNNFTVKEIVNEVNTFNKIQNNGPKKYLFVMEYADGGTLRNYLKVHSNLTWNEKLNLALQLAHAVSCLHDEGIKEVFFEEKHLRSIKPIVRHVE